MQIYIPPQQRVGARLIEELEKAHYSNGLRIVLAITWPFLHFFIANRVKGPNLPVLLKCFVISLSVSISLYLVLAFLTKGQDFLRRFADVFAVGIIVFFNYDNFRIHSNHSQASWLATLLALCVLTGYLSKKEIFSKILLGVTLVLVGIPISMGFFILAQYGVRTFNQPTNIVYSKKKESVDLVAQGGLPFPNIYYLILDGYSSQAMIKKFTNYDNSDFLNTLRKNGFYVAEKSHSNFPITYLSLASSLEMSQLLSPGDSAISSRSPFFKIIEGRNSTVRSLRHAGYQYIQFQNGRWDGSSCRGLEDLCVRRLDSHSSEITSNLLRMTPLSSLSKSILESNLPDEIDEFGFTKLLKSLPNLVKTKRPYFLFAHLFSPHPPMFFRDDCSMRDKGLENWDPPSYRAQVKCLNKRILSFLGVILKTDPKSIILLQGDHGADFLEQFKIPLNLWTPDQIQERTSILNAYKLPENCIKELYPTITPVNSFRMVLNCIGGAGMKLLEDKIFLADYEDAKDYGKVMEVNTY
jgi:hypothetical protein